MKEIKSLFLALMCLFTLSANATNWTISISGMPSMPNILVDSAGNGYVAKTQITVKAGDNIQILNNWAGSTTMSDNFYLSGYEDGITSTVASFSLHRLGADSYSYSIEVTYDSLDIVYSGSDIFKMLLDNPASTAGVEDFNKIEFTTFPNPVLDNLTIRSEKELGMVMVVSLNGEIIFNELIKDTYTNINFYDKAKGTYIVSVSNVSKKVIKQ